MQRSVFFFRADLEYDVSADTSADDSTQALPADIRAVFGAMGDLDWDREGPRSAYAQDNDGVVALRVGEIKEDHLTGQIAKIRHNGLPPYELRGNLIPLALPENAGLYEASHFVLFWDRAHPVLVMEHNVYAPRHVRLGNHLVSMLRDHPTAHVDRARFTPIIRGDVFEQLMNAGSIAAFELAVSTDTALEIEAADAGSTMLNTGLGTALGAQARAALDMQTVGIRASRGKRRSGGPGDVLKAWFSTIVGSYRQGIKTARVRVQTSSSESRTEWLDLLSDKWVQKVTVPTLEGRMVDSPAMYLRLAEAYKELAPELVPPA